ncbi:hypothetical protein EES37_29975 [Streptomyces sp. ADI91-18]|nr:hypothetical protein EES37_29975 [Streptomyces sp. ADI91-18]
MAAHGRRGPRRTRRSRPDRTPGRALGRGSARDDRCGARPRGPCGPRRPRHRVRPCHGGRRSAGGGARSAREHEPGRSRGGRRRQVRYRRALRRTARRATRTGTGTDLLGRGDLGWCPAGRVRRRRRSPRCPGRPPPGPGSADGLRRVDALGGFRHRGRLCRRVDAAVRHRSAGAPDGARGAEPGAGQRHGRRRGGRRRLGTVPGVLHLRTSHRPLRRAARGAPSPSGGGGGHGRPGRPDRCPRRHRAGALPARQAPERPAKGPPGAGHCPCGGRTG